MKIKILIFSLLIIFFIGCTSHEQTNHEYLNSNSTCSLLALNLDNLSNNQSNYIDLEQNGLHTTKSYLIGGFYKDQEFQTCSKYGCGYELTFRGYNENLVVNYNSNSFIINNFYFIHLEKKSYNNKNTYYLAKKIIKINCSASNKAVQDYLMENNLPKILA